MSRVDRYKAPDNERFTEVKSSLFGLSSLVVLSVSTVLSMAALTASASESGKTSKEQEKQAIEDAIRQLQTPKGQQKAPSPFEDFSEVSGLIVDRTITRLGEDFYFFFSQKLNDRYPNFKENLTVVEIPTALSGSIIEVEHSRKVIFRTALSPGRSKLKTARMMR